MSERGPTQAQGLQEWQGLTRVPKEDRSPTRRRLGRTGAQPQARGRGCLGVLPSGVAAKLLDKRSASQAHYPGPSDLQPPGWPEPLWGFGAGGLERTG